MKKKRRFWYKFFSYTYLTSLNQCANRCIKHESCKKHFARMFFVSNWINVTKLNAYLFSNSQFIKHIYYISKFEQKKIRLKKHWAKQRKLKRNDFDVVYLKQCVENDKHDKIRIVKKIQKSTKDSYNKKLKAIAFFSQSKVSLTNVYRITIC